MLDKKRLLIPILVVVLLFAGYGIYLFNESFNTKKEVYVPVKMEQERKYYDLVVDSVKSYKYQGKFHLSFRLTNSSNKVISYNNLNVVFIDEDGKVINKYKFNLNSVKENESKNIDIIINEKDMESYNFLIAKS